MNRKINRKDLHEKVWSTSMRKLATEFGISDRGLTKICKRHNIPLPGLGYWSKLQWNKPVKQSTLPEPEKNDEITISVVEITDEPIDETQIAEAEKIIASIENQSEPTKARSKLVNPHPFVEQTAKSFKNAENDSDGFLRFPSGPCLDVYISKDSFGRCLRIMDCLIKTLENHGFTVSLPKDSYRSSSAMVLGEEIKFMISEAYHLVEREVSAKEEKSSYAFSEQQRDHKPSGVLTFKIENPNYISKLRTQWSDTVKTKLENRIDAIVVGLIKAAVRIRSDKLRRQQIAKEREEQRKLEYQRHLQRQEEEQKIANLNAQVKNWFESRQIRAYLEALKESFIKLHGKVEPGSNADEYFKWAFGYADRLDPLVPR